MEFEIGRQVTCEAPATTANVGPGFDVLGIALASPVDRITARLVEGSDVALVEVIGDDDVPRKTYENTAGVAARAALQRAGVFGRGGVELSLVKGMQVGSGMGGSAASAAAAAFAVNEILGNPLDPIGVVEASLVAEAAVSGRHGDNVAPAVLGGLVLVRNLDPVQIVQIPVPADLVIVVVTPTYKVETKESRAILPDLVPRVAAMTNATHIATMMAAFYSGDLGLLRGVVDDVIVNPVRAAMIPGCEQVFEAALDAGALGSSISGGGPSMFAFCDSMEVGEGVRGAMMDALASQGHESRSVVGGADNPGARVV